MNFVLFYHSLVSDWNHGNAHFLRGLVRELKHLGHKVVVYEPERGWSRTNLVNEYGPKALDLFFEFFPDLKSITYNSGSPDFDKILCDADVVVVHEWNDPELIASIGQHHKSCKDYLLFFHDTHHRAVTQKEEITKYDFSEFDGVLAFGKVLRDLYLEQGWVSQAWTWHEAADTSIFQPTSIRKPNKDLVWIGNWGDGERSRELSEYLISPIKNLQLTAEVYGVRYPDYAIASLESAGAKFMGWTPNYMVPDIFSRFGVTIHVPRKPYVQALPGIPTIRVFEALACGIPLVSTPWRDCENLFKEGTDYIMVENSKQMQDAIATILHDKDFADRLALNGIESIQARHTCRHRALELIDICESLIPAPHHGAVGGPCRADL